MSKKKIKCGCGTKMYSHGTVLGKGNIIMEVYYCPNCGLTSSEPTKKKIEYKEPNSPNCVKCSCLTQKWGRRLNKKTTILARTFRCPNCGEIATIKIEDIKIVEVL